MRIEDVDDETFWVEFRAELQKKDPIGFNLESFEHILRYTVSVTTSVKGGKGFPLPPEKGGKGFWGILREVRGLGGKGCNERI